MGPSARRTTRRGRLSASADSTRGGLGVVGWLFADMMIGLFVIALATQAASIPRPQAVQRATASGPTAAAPTPEARMEQAAHVIALDVDAEGLIGGREAAGRKLRRGIRTEVRALESAGRRAALVLVWGYSPDVDTGMAIAGAAEEQLDLASGDLFSGAITREFWHRGEPGRVTLEIYLFGAGR